MTILEQRIREITADPTHYPQTSRAASESTAVWILNHAAKLTADWQRLNAKVEKGDPDLFWVAETLAAWGLAEARREPHHHENRRNHVTNKLESIGFGCICFFRLKAESLQEAK